MDELKLSAREALEQLPGELRIAHGSLRIKARFRSGNLELPVWANLFRVPPYVSHQVRDAIAEWSRSAIKPELLEHIACELGLADCLEGELIAEYTSNNGRLDLHWLDVNWTE